MTSSVHLSADAPVPVSLELLQVLDAFSSHTSAIFEDLSSNAPRHSHSQTDNSSTATSTSVRSLNALSELDERLAGLLAKARVHEANQRRIESLEEEMMRYEIEWREEMMGLEEDRIRLAQLVDRGRKDRASINKAAKAQLKPSTILSYARMLAPYTSAPPQHHLHAQGDLQQQEANPANIPGAILPYPTEEVMRRGRLAFEEVGDIGETTEMTGAKPATPSKVFEGHTTATVAPVPTAAATAARRPLHTAPREEEDEDFGFDLDLNPDL